MNKVRLVAIGIGIAALVTGIIGVYLVNQQSAERDYSDRINKIFFARDQIINEFMSDLLPGMESKQISITEGKLRVSSLVDEADKLHSDAVGMNVPEKYSSAHSHLIQGLAYFTDAVNSTNIALQYTEKALQAGQQLQTSSVTVMGTIFGFDSLPDSAEMADVRANAEAAKSAFNEAVSQLQKSEEELQTFVSTAELYINISSPSMVFDPAATGKVTKKMLEECKELGIPEFTCSEQNILEKKRLIGEGQ